MFELQPCLKGELVELRPLTADDWDELYAVGSDPLIWELHPESDRYKPEVFRTFFQGGMDSGGAFVVLDRATGKIIGSSRYWKYDAAKSEVEIGWSFLARAYWGGRYNGEMKRLMIEHALRFVESVVFLVGPKNFRSQRALEKIGAVRVADREGQVVFQIGKKKQAGSKAGSPPGGAAPPCTLTTVWDSITG